MIEIKFTVQYIEETADERSNLSMAAWGRLEYLVGGENYFSDDCLQFPEPITEHCNFLGQFRSMISTCPAFEIPNYEHDTQIWLERIGTSQKWEISSAQNSSKAIIEQEDLVKAIDKFETDLRNWMNKNADLDE